MPLVLLPAAFNHPAFVWEPKHDGFRGLAYVERGRCRLFSWTGHQFRQFNDLASAVARAVGRRMRPDKTKAACRQLRSIGTRPRRVRFEKRPVSR